MNHLFFGKSVPNFSFLSVFILIFISFLTGNRAQAEIVTIDFENVRQGIADYGGIWTETEWGDYCKGTGKNCACEYDGNGGYSWGGHYTEWNLLPVGGCVTLNNVELAGDAYWGCWSVSNKFALDGEPDGGSSFWLQSGNQFASLTCDGANDSSYYAIAYDGDACGFGPCPTIFFDEAVSVQSLCLSNTGWAVNGAILGDSFAAEAAPGYWYRVTITGRNSEGGITGMKDVMLVDYLGSTLKYVSDWTEVDLTNASDVNQAIFTNDDGDYLLSYGNTPEDVEEFAALLLSGQAANSFDDVTSLEFRVSGTDGGIYGLNIAAYFALDDLIYSLGGAVPPVPPMVLVPEPAGILLFVMLAVGITAALGPASKRRSQRA